MMILMGILMTVTLLAAGCTNRECERPPIKDPNVVGLIEARGYEQNTEEADLNALKSAKTKMEIMGYGDHKLRVYHGGGRKHEANSKAEVHIYYQIIKPDSPQTDPAGTP